jgi:hypothetical protein
VSDDDRGGGEEDDEAEHPVFARLRHLVIFHRTVFVLAAMAAGKWVPILLGAAAGKQVSGTEVALGLIEAADLVLLGIGLRRFIRLEPGGPALVTAALVVAVFPVLRATDVVVNAALTGEASVTTIRLTSIPAPSLGVNAIWVVDLVPLVLAAWLWFVVRPLHRRVVDEAPIAARALRVRWPALLVAGAVFVGFSLQVASYVAHLDTGPGIGTDRAVERATADAARSTAVGEVRCGRSSEQLSGPLVRPFYFVLFVAESSSGDGRVIAGVRMVDALDGGIRNRGTYVADGSTSANELCARLTLDAKLVTATNWPLHT